MRFDALSYEWGDATITRPVSCNGLLEVGVTENGFAAIEHLYHLQHRRRMGPLTIWIDQVCINQKDDREKFGGGDEADGVMARGQLDLMAEIYSSAETAYFWLGVGTPATDKVMDYLSRSCLPPSLGLGDIGCGLIGVWQSHIFYGEGIRDGLADVIGRGWVRRLWTLQECVLARHAEVVCGDATAPWLAIVQTAQYYDVARAPQIIQPRGWHRWADLVNIWLGSREAVPPLPLMGAGAEEHEGPRRGQVLEGHLARYRVRIDKISKITLKLLFTLALLVWVPPIIVLAFDLSWAFILPSGIYFAGSIILSLLCPGPARESMVSRTIWRLRPMLIRALVGLPFGLALGFVGKLYLYETRRLPILITGLIVCIVIILAVTGLYFPLRRYPKEPINSNKIEPPRPTMPKEESVVYELLRRECTEPRDRWFGVKALIAGDDTTGLAQDAGLPSIYQHLTVRMLQDTEALDVLLIGLYVKMPGCPSWVINWGVTVRPDIGQYNWNFWRILERRMGYVAMRRGLVENARLWSDLRYYPRRAGKIGHMVYERFAGYACGPMPPWNLRRLQEDQELEVRGCVVAEITRVEQCQVQVPQKKITREVLGMSVAPFREVMQGLAPSQLDACTKNLLLAIGARYPMFEGTWIVGEVYHGEANIDILPGQVDWRRIVQDNELDTAVVIGRLERAGRFQTSGWKTPLGVHKRLAMFFYRMETPLVQCSGDQYAGFGVACRDTQVGDKVCLIAGASLPMILRPVPDGFQVVGPAFIGGLMDGKVWEEVGPTATVILLR